MKKLLQGKVNSPYNSAKKNVVRPGKKTFAVKPRVNAPTDTASKNVLKPGNKSMPRWFKKSTVNTSKATNKASVFNMRRKKYMLSDTGAVKA